MLIKKNIETYVDITDPNDIYAPDLDAMLMTKLTNKFVGICCNSCYIVNINRIVKRSNVYMIQTLDGYAQTCVTFEVDAIIYINGEIINGCKIVRKEPNGRIHAKSDIAGIQMNIPRI